MAGEVTGDLAGAFTGDFAGEFPGDFTGAFTGDLAGEFTGVLFPGTTGLSLENIRHVFFEFHVGALVAPQSRRTSMSSLFCDQLLVHTLAKQSGSC